MQPISRRQALQLGLLGAASLTVGGVGLWRTGAAATDPPDGGAATPTTGDLVEPAVLASRDGLLRVELTPAERVVPLAGTSALALTYGTTVPGPTWRLHPGDRVQVRLDNQLARATNLHVHGLHVSPTANADNPFLTIDPGARFDYEFALPADHPPGTYWYHPHLHGSAADQVFGGLFGAIVVTDDLTVTRERVMVISDVTLTDATVARPSRAARMAGREGELLLVNGQLQPRLTARPGDVERWRVINACTSRYLTLAVDTPEVGLLAMDHQRLAPPREAGRVLLAPGNRAELLVTVAEGITEIRTEGYDRGSPMMGMMGSGAALSGPGLLATVAATGPTTTVAQPFAPAPASPDLRRRTPDGTRDLTITMGMGAGMGMLFGFDGRTFDHARTDQRVRSGDLEEWTIHNPTGMDHPFHLHVWPMQQIDVDGIPETDTTWRDVVNIPAGSRVTVRIDFAGITGRTVYHCHILDHEDLGMMGVIEVA